MNDYPYETTTVFGGPRYCVGWRNFAGGGGSWPEVSTPEQAQDLLARMQTEKAAELASHPGGSRAHIPVSWYIERITHVRRVELVSETPATELSP